MHDIDRTQPQQGEAYEFNFAGTGAEMEGEEEGFEMEAPLSEAEAMEIASELMEVQSEEELEQFLGSLVSSVGKAVSGAAGAVRDFARTPTGQALVGVLKQAAKTALPAVGTAVGTYFGGPLGAKVGSFAGQKLGQAMGLELEGLSQEDQHFEVAQQFVRLASTAAQNAAAAPTAGSPQQQAKAAFVEAAKTFAPGLIKPAGMNGSTRLAPTAVQGGHKRSGRWVRRGNGILLLGL